MLCLEPKEILGISNSAIIGVQENYKPYKDPSCKSYELLLIVIHLYQFMHVNGKKKNQSSTYI